MSLPIEQSPPEALNKQIGQGEEDKEVVHEAEHPADGNNNVDSTESRMTQPLLNIQVSPGSESDASSTHQDSSDDLEDVQQSDIESAVPTFLNSGVTLGTCSANPSNALVPVPSSDSTQQGKSTISLLFFVLM